MSYAAQVRRTCNLIGGRDQWCHASTGWSAPLTEVRRTTTPGPAARGRSHAPRASRARRLSPLASRPAMGQVRRTGEVRRTQVLVGTGRCLTTGSRWRSVLQPHLSFWGAKRRRISFAGNEILRSLWSLRMTFSA